MFDIIIKHYMSRKKHYCTYVCTVRDFSRFSNYDSAFSVSNPDRNKELFFSLAPRVSGFRDISFCALAVFKNAEFAHHIEVIGEHFFLHMGLRCRGAACNDASLLPMNQQPHSPRLLEWSYVAKMKSGRTPSRCRELLACTLPYVGVSSRGCGVFSMLACCFQFLGVASAYPYLGVFSRPCGVFSVFPYLGVFSRRCGVFSMAL